MPSTNKLPKLAILCLGVISLIYIFLEITLNFSLVNIYSQPIADLFSDPDLLEQSHNIEIYGRLISSFGISLLLFNFVYKKFSYILIKILPFLTRIKDTLPLKATVFAFLWISLVLLFRFSIEVWVHQSSEQTKLDSVRAIMFKELYNSGKLDAPDLTVLNESYNDPLQKKILTALIPTLAFIFPQINKNIEDKTDEIAASLINNNELKKYEDKVYPILIANKRLADEEFDLYVKEKKAYNKINWVLSDKNKINKFRNEKLKEVDSYLEKRWIKYSTSIDNISDYSEAKAVKLIKTYKRLESLYLDKKCYRKNEKYCQANIYRVWDKALRKENIPVKDPKFWFNTSWWDLLVKLTTLVPSVLESVACDVIVKANSPYCGVLKKHFESLYGLIKVTRADTLLAEYPFGLDLDREEFLEEEAVVQSAANMLRKQNIRVPLSWTKDKKVTLHKALQVYLKAENANIQRRYNKKSQLDLSLQRYNITSRLEFYKVRALQNRFKRSLKRYYYPGYIPQHSNAKAFRGWQGTKRQTNLDLVRMLTYKAEYGFKPGGMFYQLGIDAVKFSIIPTVSIVLSVIGVLSIFIKLLLLPIYNSTHGQRTVFTPNLKFWMLYTIAIAGLVLYTPLINKYYIKNISMELAVPNTNVSGVIHNVKGFGFGYVLDAQSNLFKVAGGLNLDLLSLIPSRHFDSIKSVDNLIFDELSEYSHYSLLTDKIKNTDINVTIYRKEYDVLMAMGLAIDNNKKITGVSVPIAFDNKELDVLFDTKLLYGSTDYKSLFLASLKDARSPDFWVDIASSAQLQRSMKDVLESKMLVYLNQNYPKGTSSLRFMPKNISTGNIVLVNLSRSRYDCYYLPPFNFNNLVNIISAYDDAQSYLKYKCKWSL